MSAYNSAMPGASMGVAGSLPAVPRSLPAIPWRLPAVPWSLHGSQFSGKFIRQDASAFWHLFLVCQEECPSCHTRSSYNSLSLCLIAVTSPYARIVAICTFFPTLPTLVAPKSGVGSAASVGCFCLQTSIRARTYYQCGCHGKIGVRRLAKNTEKLLTEPKSTQNLCFLRGNDYFCKLKRSHTDGNVPKNII